MSKQTDAACAFTPVPGYASFMERGRGWEQCSVFMSRKDARKHTLIRRQLEQANPMGKKFKTKKVTHNEKLSGALKKGEPHA